MVYLHYFNNPQFQRLEKHYKIKKSLHNPGVNRDVLVTSHDSHSKIIVESIIYVDDFDMFVFTTVAP